MRAADGSILSDANGGLAALVNEDDDEEEGGPGRGIPTLDAPDPNEMNVNDQKSVNHNLKKDLFDHEERIVNDTRDLLHRAETKPKEIK
jgi:hypothetical protein